MTPTEALASLGLTIRAEFVPFSLSRHNGKTKGLERWESLNWRVTLLRNDREILATDYSAGIAHAPGYTTKVPASWDRPHSMWPHSIAEWEIENGFEATWMSWSSFTAKRRPATEAERNEGKRDQVRIAILPDPNDVWASMILDLVEEPFEDWAPSLGYDPDSIRAKAIYDVCVEHTMKLRGALGNAAIETLREAFQDY